MLVSFVIGAYGAFLLTSYVAKDLRAGFIAGLIYAFSPYHYVELGMGHLNLLSIQWIPFYCLYLLRTLRERGWRNPLLAAVFLWLNALAEWQYFGFLGMYTVLFLLFYWWSDRETFLREGFVGRFIVLLIFSSILILPFLYPLTYEAFVEKREGYAAGIWIGTSMLYSANFGAYVLPNYFNPIIGKFVEGIELKEGMIPLGYATILLSIYALWQNKELRGWISSKITRARKLLWRKTAITPVSFTLFACLLVSYMIFGANVYGYAAMILLSLAFVIFFYMIKDRVMGFWLAVLIVFLVLSAGPVLQLPDEEFYPLPYILFYYLPLFKTFRAPYRFTIMVVLGLSVLAGSGVKDLLEKRKKSWKALFVILTLIVLFENLSVPVALSNADTPDIYQEIASESGDFAVLVVPIPPRIHHINNETIVVYGIPQLLYYQTIHQMPMIGGYISRITETPEYAMQPLENTPLLFHLRHPFEEDIVDQNLSEIGVSVLKHLGVRYVVVHEDLYSTGGYPEDSYNYSVKLLESVVGEKANEEGDVVYFTVQEQVGEETFLMLGEGWSRRQEFEGRPVRLVEESASFDILNAEEDDSLGLSFSVESLNGTSDLKVFLNDKLLETLSVGENEETLEVTLTHLKEGYNTIEIRASSVEGMRFYNLALDRQD
ncbi:hypothetical protein ACFLRC_01545 [Candidatus Altiarchaeota archaeon]